MTREGNPPAAGVKHEMRLAALEEKICIMYLDRRLGGLEQKYQGLRWRIQGFGGETVMHGKGE